MRPYSIASLALVALLIWFNAADESTEAAALMNQPPAVTLSGGNMLLTPPATTTSFTATVVDDGLPVGSTLSYSWCRESGPGPVIFSDPTSPTTDATFDVAGTYVIEFTASDGMDSTTKSLSISLAMPANLPTAVVSILNSFSNPALDPLYADRFLTLVPNAQSPMNATGAQYYAAVDPLNQKTTFAAWKLANGFGPGNPPLVASIAEDSATGCCSAGLFGNAGDLGFGRRMVMSRTGDEIAFYVTNYDTLEATIAEDPARIILTVCMEYSRTPGAANPNPYIKYFMYDGSGNRISDVDFDGRGPKPVPLACAACHGGGYSTNGGIPANGDMGAIFLPFDLETFDYPCEPGFSREDQEQSFKEFNEAVLASNPPPAIVELIEGWYGGFGLPSDNQNPFFVPTGWQSEPELYRQVVAKSCRNCHLTRTSSLLNFDSASDFADPAIAPLVSGPIVFGPSPSGFMMPHAERTFERFWLSTTPHQPGMLAAAYQNGVFVGLGAPSGRAFVDPAAVGLGDGSSWNDAFTDLGAALTAAAQPGANITELWVAGGTHRPSTIGLADPRTATFTIPDGLKVYGGFTPGDTLLEQRDLEANETILSGDLNDDDFSGGDSSENAYTVVTMNNCSIATRLDGFTIIGGNAGGALDPRGGGLRVTGGSPQLVRLLVDRCEADGAGGMLADGTGARLSNVGFYGNDGRQIGGGILAVNGSSLRVENSIFSFNLAEDAGGLGGGIYVDGGNLDVVNSTFYRNYADVDAGGIQIANGAQVSIGNSILWRNCTLNVIDEDAQITLDNGMAPVSLAIDHCLVHGWTGVLGGQGNSGADPLFIDPNGADTQVGTRDDDMRVQEGSPAVDAGNNDIVGLDSFDLDIDFYTGEAVSLDFQGLNRFFDSNLTADTGVGDAPVVDIGAIERNDGSLGPCAAGNIRVGVDGPHDVLEVNGSAGGSPRLVYVGTGQALTISIDQPPMQPFAPFTIFLSFGVPGPDDVTTLDFGLGDMCFTPAPLQPFNDGDFVLADSLGLGFGAAAGATIAPWSLMIPALGPVEGDFVLQGLIWDDTKPIPLSVTNAVLVSVREDPPVNLEPVAAVTNDSFGAFTNAAGVTLDGSPSFDPEGESLTYSWTQTGGVQNVTIVNADQAVATFTAPPNPDLLTFELVVDDGANQSPPVTVTINVESDTPIANAGPDQVVDTNDFVSLDGSASADPQGTPLSYSWTQIGGLPVTSPSGLNSVSPTFTAPDSSTTVVFRLIVSDGVNMSLADTVSIQVRTSFEDDVYPIFQAGQLDCVSCHNPGGLAAVTGLYFDYADPSNALPAIMMRINLGVPSQSLLLRQPLAQAAGGFGHLHTGGTFFANTMDPDYLTILNWISDGAPDN